MKNEVAISINHVYKQFHEKQIAGSFKEVFVNVGRKINGKKEKRLHHGEYTALKDIDFEIKKGEFFGIVGRNGSGKSTLLKIIAGVYSTSRGSVSINGTLTPFIELGVGFNPELSGRDNVFLNGALLGFTRKQMEAMYDDIVEFAELKDFMEMKLKNYSSGMQVRLAFSVAIRAESDILLIDEVLAVGDAAFQKKCYEYFLRLKKENRTVVLVTHDMSAVEKFCDRVAVIDKAEFKGEFAPKDAALFYEKVNLKTVDVGNGEISKINRWGTRDVTVEKIEIKSGEKISSKNIDIMQNDNIEVVIKLSPKKETKQVVIGLAFYDEFGVNMSGPNSIGKKILSHNKAIFRVRNISFNPGKYFITVVIFDKNVVQEYDHIEKALSFNVSARSHQLHGKINLFGEWRIS